ncbi:MAG: MATE family efflux transporter [Eubacteriales bacterium]|nr:MATE family efflux transporter [Eubacteriales bacterium]
MEEQQKQAAGAPLFTGKELWRLIWPLLVEQTLAVTVGMADTMMVSRAGEAAISGVSLVDMINVLIINLFAALATGGAVVVSQYLGAKSRERAERGAGQLVLLSAILGLSVGMLCFFLAAPMVGTVYSGLTADVFEASVTYLKITAISYPFLALYNAGAAIFRSMGNSRISMQVSILMNLVNIVGNAVGVLVLNLGVAGVAWPSVVSRTLAAALILWCAAGEKNLLRLRPSNLRRIDGVMARRILTIGIPSAFENSLFQAGRILVVSIITAFGTVQITANAVANNLDGMFCIPGQAIGLAMIAVIGRCIGAGEQRQAIRYTRLLTGMAYAAMGVTGALMLGFLPQVLGFYVLSGETLALAELLVRIHCGCGMVLWPLAFVLPNSLRAAGDVRFTMIVSIVSMAIWRIGFSYFLGLSLGMGAIGVWIAMIIDWVCRTICFVWRFASGAWKKKYHA